MAPRSSDERQRARVKLARKWAYLVSVDSYVPHTHIEVEQAMLELVHTLFAAVAAADITAAAAVGAHLVELNCVGGASLVSTLDVLTTAMLTDQDTRGLDRLPERVGRVLGGLVSGLTETVRRTVLEQQDSMCRALMTTTRKAIRETEAREAEVGELSTELSLVRARLGHQLLHDALTGLPNRQFFVTRLEEALDSGRPVTLFCLELSGFALVNDGLGLLSSEAWLIAAADRIHRAVADRVTLVARLDGFHFAIMQESASSATDIAALVGLVNETLAEPAYLDGIGLATTASVGVVQSPPHRPDADGLLHAAHLALRAAKRRLLRLAVGLPGVSETGQLEIGYEPRVGLADDRPVGVHAFLHWRDPERDEPWHPNLALAEQTGLTPQLGSWLLRDAADQLRDDRLRSWHGRSGTDLVLAVSLSPNQSAAPDLVDTVLSVLEGSLLRPERLQIAMPATEVCHGRVQTTENLSRIAATGVRTAVHDFDGGAPELIQLADLPVYEVWFGQRMVRQARRTDKASLIADTMTGLVGLVHRAGAAVGVDDIRARAEADWWRRVGADTASGRLYCPAGAHTDIADLLG